MVENDIVIHVCENVPQRASLSFTLIQKKSCYWVTNTVIESKWSLNVPVYKYKCYYIKMKSTEVQTLGELSMSGIANGWAGLLVFTRGLPLVARDTG